MQSPTTLIVCSTMPESRSYYKAAIERGENIIACSSIKNDEADKIYENWQWLPDVYHPEFLTHLKKLISDNNVARIFCPHDLMFITLRGYIDSREIPAKLLGNMPSLQRMESIQELYRQAQESQDFLTQINASNSISLFRLIAILRQAEQTFGESSVTKQLAAMAIFPDLPKGDIIEVGSLWGKMAVVLAMLARDYNKGALLCVDPWQREHAMQKDSPAIEKMPNINDWDLLFKGFTINMAVVAEPGKFNYLRYPSTNAAEIYSKKQTITSPEFGSTKYLGKIALIHIDGNHDYKNVREDYFHWRPHLISGGWIILDDYVWHHGDGPKRFGDEIILSESDAIVRSFVAGKALFMQFK